MGAVIGFSKTLLSYTQSDYYNGNPYQYQESLKWSSLSLGAHSNYHFVTKEKLDVYVGLGLGYNINTLTYSNNDPYNNAHTNYSDYNPHSLYYVATIGLRYYFTPNIGVYAEGGIDKSCLLLGGLAVKF